LQIHRYVSRSTKAFTSKACYEKKGKFLPTRRTSGISTSELLSRIVEGYRGGDYDNKFEKIGRGDIMSRPVSEAGSHRSQLNSKPPTLGTGSPIHANATTTKARLSMNLDEDTSMTDSIEGLPQSMNNSIVLNAPDTDGGSRTIGSDSLA